MMFADGFLGRLVKAGDKSFYRGGMLLLVCLIAVGCRLAQEPGLVVPPAEAITDHLGRQVSGEKEAQRIVCLAPSFTETMYFLGLGERVVGVTTYCNFPPEARQKEKIGGFSADTVSLEKIVSLAPDLVVAEADMHRELVPELEKLGVRVVAFAPKTVAETMDTVRLLGRLTGARSAAESVASSMERRVDEVRRRVASLGEDDRPVVYYEIWNDPLMTAGPGTFVHELITLAGGRNMAEYAGQLYPQVSLETIVAADPQVIICPYADTGGLENFRARKGWAAIRAVREGKVFVVTDDLVSRPGPRIVEGLEEIARAIHPELFEKR